MAKCQKWGSDKSGKSLVRSVAEWKLLRWEQAVLIINDWIYDSV
jgi:hypothetical protein